MNWKSSASGLASFCLAAALQVSGYQNIWLAYVLYIFGVSLLIYSFHDHCQLRLWPQTMIPLHDAARLALDAIDGSVLAVAARRQFNAPNGALCFVATRLFMDEIPIYGKQIPSSKLLKISADLLFANEFANNATIAQNMHAKEVTYIDLAIKKSDLNVAIIKLKEKHPPSPE